MGGALGGAAPLLLALAVAATGRRRRSTALLILAAAMLLGIGGAQTTTEGAGGAERGPRRPRRRRLPPRGGGPPRLEVVEGCFNRFDALAEVPINEEAIVGHFNNIRCQVACGERGYALAATRSSPQACLCGNDYPSAFHQLDAGKCDAPCNPDQASCLLFTCCGDRNGTHFTVSFAQQQDPVLQVLRQMAFDYRTSSPTFHGQIEGELVDASPLRILAGRGEGSGGGEGEGGQPYFLAAPAAGAAADGCLSDGDGGSGWAPFEGTCYKLHWAQSVAQDEARQQCLHDAAGSDLVVPASAAQNAFVAQLQGGCQGWLGIRLGDRESAWNSSGLFHNFTAGGGDGTGCVQLSPDGGWVRAPCGAPSMLLRHHQHPGSQHADCFVCQQARVAAAAAATWREAPVALSGADTDTWRLIECPQQQEAAGIGVWLQHEASGHFLGCSRESGRLVLLNAREGEDRTTFVARVDEDDGSFTLTQGSLAVAVDEEGRLTCRPMDPQHRRGWVDSGPAVARFQPTCMLRVLAWRHLRLSVVVLSSDLQMRGWRACSVAAYDTSPTTVSYRCKPVPSVPAGIDEMWLEQQALLVSDWHRWLLPRYPLPLGRLRCVNEHPRASAICTLAYGRGVTMARAITIDWNTFIGDTITTRCTVQAALTANVPLPAAAAFGGAGGDEGGGGGGGDGDSNNAFRFQTTALKELSNDFTVIFSQFYEVAVVRAYVETRNWQTSIRAQPLSTITAQLWLEQVRLTYRWRALFQARGSFRITYCGRPIGGQHSIGDLVNYDDVFFFVFGSYDVPQHASIILTIDDRDESRWPLDLPETSIAGEPFLFPHGRRRQR